jgi:NAD(P)-dependent dehydrogenase (short-subunit alcohol dehydrogenase family)
MVDAVSELAGKVAIVTGSARNIGRATAVELARAGASVTVAARSAGDLCRAAAAEIEAEGGRRRRAQPGGRRGDAHRLHRQGRRARSRLFPGGAGASAAAAATTRL